MKRLCLLSILALAFSSMLMAQGTRITGVVISEEDGQPVIGASVLVKGTTKGAITDVNGSFEIPNVSEGSTLVVTYVGMVQKEVKATGGRQKITLTPDSKVLGEVVVTALGITREKKSLGYTTQEIKAADLENAKESNFVNSLAGKVAGVKVTNTAGDMGSSTIILRGETSISGDNQPLFIIDGVPLDNTVHTSSDSYLYRDFKNPLADLNSNDIESISVLKGPNAAALYGSRAAHGVILITTKNGKGKKGVGVEFHSSFMFNTVSTLPEWQNEFGQGSNLQFEYVDGQGSGTYDSVDESWGPRLDAGLYIKQFDSPINEETGEREATPWVSNPDNVSDFFETGYTYTAGLSIANSDEKFDYRLSYNYERQNGVTPGSESKKNNFAFNGSYKVTDRLEFGSSANYIINDIPNYPGGSQGMRAAGVMLQFLWFGRQVSMTSMKNDYSLAWAPKWYSNPYWRAYNNVYSQKRDRLVGNVYAKWTIIDGLVFTFKVSQDSYSDDREYTIAMGTAGTPDGSYTLDQYKFNETNYDAMLQYTKNINKDWSIDALVGWNRRDQSLDNMYAKANSLSVDGLYTLQSSASTVTNSSYKSRIRTYSLFGSAQVGYKNYAFLNITGRNDWSSTLPADNNSYFYPSVSASALLTDIFKIKSDALNYLKVRAGWSQVGNDASAYQLKNTYESLTSFDGNALLTVNTDGKNDDLKPEITSSTEAGIEATFLKGRLHLDLAYYYTISRDQILNVETSASSGSLSKLLNAGKITNQGWEVQLSGTPIKSKDFSWDATINFATNKSKVKELDKEGLITSYTIYDGTVQVVAEVGKAFGTIKGTTYTRDENGNIVVDSNGLPIVNNTYSDLGKYTPDWTGSISNTFRYKNISLSFLIDCSFGGEIFSGTNQTGTYTGVLASTLPGRASDFGGITWTDSDGNVRDDGIIVDGVTESGEVNTTVVSAEDYYHRLYSIHECFVSSSEYVKLREVALTYNFPRWKWLDKLHITGGSVTLVGRNLWTIHKAVDNIDPESSLSGNLGVESLNLPSTRSYGITLNVKF